MSMLQAQCDKLRERAATLRQGRWSDGADDARLMEDAADTIWELRDDLQQANAKNAKLRELCSKLAQVVANDDVTFRRLREIAKQELGYDFIGAYDSSLGDMDQLPLFSDHMRELGVEP